jgi:alkaline phosphatase D
MDRWYHLFDHRLTRRDFLRVSADAAACVALSGLPGELFQDPRTPDTPFIYGVASGDPRDDSVVLWTRLAARDGKGARVNWELAEDDGFRRIVKRGNAAAPKELGFSVHADVDGLRSGRDYWYRFHAGGHTSAAGRTRTMPAGHAEGGRFNFAFVSCQNYEHGHYTAFKHLADEQLDLIVHLGDYIYERRFDAPAIVREHEAGEVMTLDDYRGRYGLYRQDPHLQAAHAAAPWIVTTDDHEVSNNYANDVPQVAMPREQFLLRRAAAYQAYYEFMPLRRSSMPRGPSMQLYRHLDAGRLLRFHVLDTRQYRADQACGDGGKPRCADVMHPARSMFGDKQEEWLAKSLRRSRARWNVLANQVMVAELRTQRGEEITYSMDRWDGYVPARDRLIAALRDTKAANPVIITGDIHTNWVADIKANFEDPHSATVATEFVGTSMSSGGDGAEGDPARGQSLNPHIKFFNGRRGYVRATVTPSLWATDYRVVPYVSRPGAPIDTRATFVVEHGQSGAVRA